MNPTFADAAGKTPLGQACRENVRANQRSLELIEAGIDRGRFQFPDLDGPDDCSDDLTTLLGLRDLIRLREHHARVLATDGELAAAGQVLLRSLKMTEMILRGDGYSLHFMTGVAMRARMLASIRAFTFSALAPAKEMTELFAAVGGHDLVHASLVRAVWRDFHCCCVPVLERLAEAGPLGRFIDSLLENYYSSQPMLPVDNPPEPDDRNAWRRDPIVDLLEGHPAPFDKAETLRLASEAVAAVEHDSKTGVVGSSLAAAATKESVRAPDDGDWPAHLSPACAYDLVGHGVEARKNRDELKAFSEQVGARLSPEVLATFEPPSDAELAVAKRKLRRVSNPVGRMLVANSACVPTVVRMGATWIPVDEVATKVSLALRLYVYGFGSAPAELSELVSAGLLPAMPLDPFSGRPLRYSRGRQLLWSVGWDRKDGDGDPHTNMVWRVPITDVN